MSPQLDLLVALGNDILSTKYYGIATFTILFYDYSLTLADEVEYVWSRKKSWTFWLFLVNRYFPMTYKLLLLPLSYGPHVHEKICDRIAFYFILTIVVCTLLAQVALTVRIYAVTMKNIPIVIGFAIITASQLALGTCVMVLTEIGGAQSLEPIPLDAYRVCVFAPHRTLEIAYNSISLLFDFLAFSLIMFLAIQSSRRTAGLKIQTLLVTIAEDAMLYFLVIFTSHFVLEMTIILGRDSIQLLPGPGLVVYLPVMVSRLMLSLRKAAESQHENWTLGGISANLSTNTGGVEFFRPRMGTISREDGALPLHAYSLSR